jgi:ligand-binding SRPBCC domain-containing protein
MARIILHTLISASPERCFDLSRDADVHLLSTKHTNERVVKGRTSGLFEMGDNVTWEAVHLGIKQRLSTVITGFHRPVFFEDTMKKGAFKSMRHEHHFKNEGDGTLMTDIFEYEVPLGLPGKFFDFIYLRKYMTNLLTRRNACIKELAEKEHNRTINWPYSKH